MVAVCMCTFNTHNTAVWRKPHWDHVSCHVRNQEERARFKWHQRCAHQLSTSVDLWSALIGFDVHHLARTDVVFVFRWHTHVQCHKQCHELQLRSISDTLTRITYHTHTHTHFTNHICVIEMGKVNNIHEIDVCDIIQGVHVQHKWWPTGGFLTYGLHIHYMRSQSLGVQLGIHINKYVHR